VTFSPPLSVQVVVLLVVVERLVVILEVQEALAVLLHL